MICSFRWIPQSHKGSRSLSVRWGIWARSLSLAPCLYASIPHSIWRRNTVGLLQSPFYFQKGAKPSPKSMCHLADCTQHPGQNRRVLATLLNVISKDVSFWWAHKYIFSVCSRKAYWFFYLFTLNKSSYISWLDHSKSAPGYMGHEGIDKFPVPLYDFWNTCINNSCPDKYNLGKNKHFLVGSVFCAIEHNK